MKLNCSCDATVQPEQEALGAGRGGVIVCCSYLQFSLSPSGMLVMKNSNAGERHSMNKPKLDQIKKWTWNATESKGVKVEGWEQMKAMQDPKCTRWLTRSRWVDWELKAGEDMNEAENRTSQ